MTYFKVADFLPNQSQTVTILFKEPYNNAHEYDQTAQ